LGITLHIKPQVIDKWRMLQFRVQRKVNR
jgi:hypothetical protein